MALQAISVPWMSSSCLNQERSIMLGTQSERVDIIRSLARTGRRPSEILRTLIALESSGEAGEVDRNLLVQYFSEAFYFADGEAYPIFGWRQDGTGELSDAAIDELLEKRMQRTQSK
jgi:hypothetical protein